MEAIIMQKILIIGEARGAYEKNKNDVFIGSPTDKRTAGYILE